MGDLIYFEMKRIYKKRSTIVILTVMFIAMLFFIYMRYIDNPPSQNAIIGTGKVEETLINQVMDARKDLIHDERHYTNGKIESRYYIEYYEKYRDIDSLLSTTLSKGFYTDDSVVENSEYISTEAFYRRWIEKQHEILKTDYSYGNYSDSEIRFFMDKIQKLETPFVYNGNNGWKLAMHLIPWLGLIIGSLNCLIIAPIVSYDYQNKVDSLILSSQYGRNKSAWCKNSVVLLVTTINTVIVYGVFTGIMVSLYGIRGYKDSTAVWLESTPYNLTNIEAYLYLLLLALLGILALAQISLMISILNKWVYISMAISFGIAIFPKFIQHSRESRLLNYCVDLLPANLMDGYSSIASYKCYSIFGILLLQGTVKIIVSVLLIIIVMMLNRYIYTRRIVKG